MTRLTRIVAELEFENITSLLAGRNITNIGNIEDLTFQEGDSKGRVKMLSYDEVIGEFIHDEGGVYLCFNQKYAKALTKCLPFKEHN